MLIRGCPLCPSMTQRADASDIVQDLEPTESHVDGVFASLAIGRRRAALQYLREAEPPVAVGELAAAVAGGERRDDVPARQEKWADASTEL